MLDLTHCLKMHLETASQRATFFQEICEAENWVRDQTERLSNYFQRSGSVSVDEGEALIRELHQLHDILKEYQSTAVRLQDEAQEIVPLALRKSPITTPIRGAWTLCAVRLDNKNYTTTLEKNTKLDILHNTGNMWLVRTASGAEHMVSAACIQIPPPCKEAQKAVGELRVDLHRLTGLWLNCELQLRQDLLKATMDVVRAWSPEEFRLLEPTRRRKVVEALNQDAERLLQDMHAAEMNPKMIGQFQQELQQCNTLFNRHSGVHTTEGGLQQQASDSEPVGSVASLVGHLTSLRCILVSMEATLDAKLACGAARDVDQLEVLVLQHRDFETNLQSYEAQMEYVARACRQDELNGELADIEEIWERLWRKAQNYVERLKSTEAYLSNLDELMVVLDEVELRLLASHNSALNNAEQLQQATKDLQVGMFCACVFEGETCPS